MKRRKKLSAKFISIVTAILFLLLFYLRQQYVIIKLQKEINSLYEQIRIEENKNKQLILELQKLTDIERLKKFAKQLNFAPIKETDIIIIE